MRNCIDNRAILVFLIISGICTITNGILASKSMLTRRVAYVWSTCAYFDITSGNNSDSENVYEDET